MENGIYTHVVVVVDRSNSMYEKKLDVQTAINDLISEQFNQPGKLTLTLTEFDNSIDTVKRMSTEKFDYQLHPRFGSALFDAVSQEIAQTSSDIAALALGQRPDLVKFIVFTDGHDSESSIYTLGHVQEAVQILRATGTWDFGFIGADLTEWQSKEKPGQPGIAEPNSVQGIVERIKAIHTKGSAGDCEECFMMPHPCPTLEELDKLEALEPGN